MRVALIQEDRLTVRQDYPLPTPHGEEALIRVRLAGVCATDIELLRGYKGGFRGVLGHEFVGEVVRAPADPGWEGRRVVGEINVGCGVCALCRRGLAKHCRQRTSLGMIGRMVCERLRTFDLNLIAYDPFVSAEDAAALGVTLCGLDEIFQRADVVSLHTPWLPETVGMITGAHLAAMQPGATFINTARGDVVREQEMIEVLQQRPDLLAVLDVTYPEPPVAGSPFYTLPNVILTPHIAGSMDNECRRTGRIVVEELQRYLKGEPLRWSISRQQAAIMA